jgi:hypothetical protein
VRTPTAFGTVLAAIECTGLVPRGAFLTDAGERKGPLAGVRTIFLIGTAGRMGWDAFAASPEARDGLDHPLDRFSRRVIGALADDLGALALFPFGGPPYWPFQQWARRSETVHASPIGLLIHPRFGRAGMFWDKCTLKASTGLGAFTRIECEVRDRFASSSATERTLTVRQAPWSAQILQRERARARLPPVDQFWRAARLGSPICSSARQHG